MLYNSPVKINNLLLRNRLVVAPMQQNKGSIDGFAAEFHQKHYSDMADKVGLVIIESTAVSPNGRLYLDDIGIFSDKHVEPLKDITDAVHRKNTPVFIQLSHGGRKSARYKDHTIFAPSAIPYDEQYGLPAEINEKDIDQIIKDYKEAAKRSLEAGFDGIELHAAHGYLLHQFLSPLTNHRVDQYGGSLENRVRIIKQIGLAIRETVGWDFPFQIRISASDFHKSGLTPGELAEAMNLLNEVQFDAIHVSAGGLLPVSPGNVHTGYQIPYSAIMKQYVKVPVIAVGLIREPDHVEQILQEGLADLIAIGRPLLENPQYIVEKFFPQ